MQMMGFLYCLRWFPSVSGSLGPSADASAPGAPGDPFGRVPESTCSWLAECSPRRWSSPRGPCSIKRRSRTEREHIKLSADTEAGGSVTTSFLPHAGWLFLDLASNLQKPLLLLPKMG